MKLKPLEKIKMWNLKNYAENNVQRYEEIYKKGLTEQKDDINFFCRLKGMKIYFVLYTQKDTYLVRHSYILKKKGYPSQEQVNSVLQVLGFKGQIKEDLEIDKKMLVVFDENQYAVSISELL